MGEEVIFLPTHTASNPCAGKVFTVEMHHQRADFANPGDNVGLNIKGLDKQNMPRSGDVMVYKKDTSLGQTSEFAAQIQVLYYFFSFLSFPFFLFLTFSFFFFLFLFFFLSLISFL